MYKVKSHKSKRGKINHNIDFVNLDGFIMSSKKKYFMIDGEKVSFVKVVDEDLVKEIKDAKKPKNKKLMIAGIVFAALAVLTLFAFSY